MAGLQKMGEHCWCYPCEYYSDRPNIGYIRGTDRALLFEAGNSAEHAEQIRAALMAEGLPLPDYLAVSHWHWDHVFGMHAWDIPKIAGRKTNEKLRELSGLSWDDEALFHRVETGEEILFCAEMIRREYPDRGRVKVIPADLEFTGEMSVDLGGVTCRLIHAEGPHSEDSVICFVPEDGFIFLGDSNGKDLYGKEWQFDIRHEDELTQTLDRIPYDPELVKPYLQKLEKLAFVSCIGGHAPAMTREELLESFGTCQDG